MNPGVERACTGVLPHARLSSKIAAATSTSVCSPETTSTSFISGTGLKKCMPTSRPGRFSPLASAVIEIDDVFEARIARSSTIASSCRNSARLASRFSTIASITTPAPAAWSSDAAAPIRAADRPSHRRRRACPWRRARRASRRAWRAPSRPRPRGCRTAGPRGPAWAATCAMPAPMMPAPTTKTGVSLRMSMVMARDARRRPGSPVQRRMRQDYREGFRFEVATTRARASPAFSAKPTSRPRGPRSARRRCRPCRCSSPCRPRHRCRRRA